MLFNRVIADFGHRLNQQLTCYGKNQRRLERMMLPVTMKNTVFKVKIKVVIIHKLDGKIKMA